LAERPDGAHGEEHPAAVGQGDEPIARIESGSSIIQGIDHHRHGADTFVGQPQAPEQGVHQQEFSQPLPSARQVPGQASKEDDLTSQVLANFFLHPFDEWMVSRFSSCGYARYVDDFVLISSCQWALRGAVSKVRVKLREEFALKLHPRKVKLQRVRHGVPFLGVVVFPGRLLPDRRPRGSFREAIHGFNRLAVSEGDAVAMGQWDASFRASLNSYLGGLSQTRSKGFRLRSWRKVKAPWQERFVLSSDARKIQPRR